MIASNEFFVNEMAPNFGQVVKSGFCSIHHLLGDSLPYLNPRIGGAASYLTAGGCSVVDFFQAG